MHGLSTTLDPNVSRPQLTPQPTSDPPFQHLGGSSLSHAYRSQKHSSSSSLPVHTHSASLSRSQSQPVATRPPFYPRSFLTHTPRLFISLYHI